MLFYEGHHPLAAYCLLAGRVKVYRVSADGQHRILRLQPGGAGHPTTVSEFASWGQPGGQGGLLQDEGFQPSALVAYRNGSVLVGGEATGKVLRLRDGLVDLLPGLEEPLGSKPFLLELADGSILGTSRDRDSILRVAGNGEVHLFAGYVPEDEETQPEHPFNWRGLNMGGLCLGRDGSVLVQVGSPRGTENPLGPSVVRIGDGAISLVAGPQPSLAQREGELPLLWPFYRGACPVLPVESSHFPALPPGSSVIAAELTDGTLLFSSLKGIMLISPADALQTTLEQMVERGKAALNQGRSADWQAVKHELEALSQPFEATLAAVSKEGGHGRLTRKKGPALYKDLVQHIAGFANHPMERLRARLALMELQGMERLLAPD